MRRIAVVLFIASLVAGGYLAFSYSRPAAVDSDPALKDIAGLVESVRSASYPQLKDAQIAVSDLRSDYIYFESRFTLSSFFFARTMRYTILFNREAVTRRVPAEGLRAIVAHELAHIDYFRRQSKMGLLGLARLMSASYAARFERDADLEAIALGYGRGLQSFRMWLYRNVPPSRMEEKRRDYFSPEEIEAILRADREHPEIMRTFARCIPRSLNEIDWEAQNPTAACRP